MSVGRAERPPGDSKKLLALPTKLRT